MSSTAPEYQLLLYPAVAHRRAEIDELVAACWSAFMLEDPVANEYWENLYEQFPEYQFVLVDSASGQIAALGNSLPLHYEANLANLPDEGWDWALEKGSRDRAAGLAPTIQCALSIAILPELRGKALSYRMVSGMKAIGADQHLGGLIAPVRPSLKSRYPLTPIERYITWTQPDGTLFDPWLRVHERLGAKLIKPCPRSMRIPGSIARWETWAQMRFPESGQYIVPDALTPLQVDRARDEAVYIEPNVWMFHG